METVVLAAKGTKRQIIDVNKIRIPDLWHVAMRIKEGKSTIPRDAEDILEAWHLCHDLKSNIIADRDGYKL